MFSLQGCPDGTVSDQPQLGIGDTWISLVVQCPQSAPPGALVYIFDHDAVLNGTLGDPPPAEIALPFGFRAVNNSEDTITSNQYMAQPVVDLSNNLSLSVGAITLSGCSQYCACGDYCSGSFDPSSVTNYPLSQTASIFVPYGNQAADSQGDKACTGCIGSINNIYLSFLPSMVANTSFNNYFGFDTIYAALSTGLPTSQPATYGGIVFAAVQPDANQAFSMLYSPASQAEEFTYGSIAGACPKGGCCEGGQWLGGYADFSSTILPSAAYVTGTLTPSGFSLSSSPTIFQRSSTQRNKCASNPVDSNLYCRWGDYTTTTWDLGNYADWWTDGEYSYVYTDSSLHTWANLVAGVPVPVPSECK